MNYTEREIPYTRIIEHKHFEFGNQKSTVITREYPLARGAKNERYYPVNNERNNALYQDYKALAERRGDVIFGGRLGGYAYLDMDKTVEAALEAAGKEFS